MGLKQCLNGRRFDCGSDKGYLDAILLVADKTGSYILQ